MINGEAFYRSTWLVCRLKDRSIANQVRGSYRSRQQEIHAERERKLEQVRKQRQIRRQQAA